MSVPVPVLPRTVPREREALLLAGLLRSARLTLLCGEAGAGKSVLLESGVMPLLHRRASDQAVPPGLAPRVVIPFPERRNRVAGGAGRSPEVAILLADWSGDPLIRLQAQLHEALAIAEPQQQAARVSLAGTLTALNMQFGARFILLLDRFDDCLVSAAEDECSGAGVFLDEFMIAADRPLLPANFLIAIRNDADPLLEPLRARLPGLGDQTLRLSRLPAPRSTPPSLWQVPRGEPPAGGAASPVRAIPAPAESNASSDAAVPRSVARQSDEDWLASLNAVVMKAAEAARTGAPAESVAQAAATPVADAVPLPAEVMPSPTAVDAEHERAATVAPLLGPLPRVAREEAPARAADLLPLPLVEGWGRTGVFEPHAASPESSPGVQALTRPASDGQRQTEITSPPEALRPRPATALPRSLAWLGVPVGLVLIAWLAWPNGSPTSAPQVAQAPIQPTSTESKLATPDALAAAVPAAPSPAPKAIAATTPSPTPLPSPSPIATASIDIDDPAASRVALELARALAATDRAPTSTIAAPTWPAGFTPLPGRPGFALARYDALQAARQSAPGSALQVIAPLYTEDVLFIAHADSPLAFIHDIRRARINVGPAQGSRAVTAGAVYQRFFGAALPAASADARSANDVLGPLASGKSIDVMVVAGPQAASWWAGLPPEMARALKLLKIDRADPADRSALQTFLPATVRAGADAGTPTLGVMSFLVAVGTPEATSQIAPAVRALCGALPGLQRDGSPKWREFQPGLRLETGWPNARAASALRACATPVVVAGKR